MVAFQGSGRERAEQLRFVMSLVVLTGLECRADDDDAFVVSDTEVRH